MEQSGLAVEDVIAELAARRHDDVAWAAGRTFSLVYDGGPTVHEVAERAATMYLHENALNTAAFPSLAGFQSDVVRWTAELLLVAANFSGEHQPLDGIPDPDGWRDAELVIGNVDEPRPLADGLRPWEAVVWRRVR